MKHIKLPLLLCALLSQACALGLFGDDEEEPPKKTPPVMREYSCSDNICTLEADCTGMEQQLCSSPPAATCLNAQTLVSYGAQGVCVQDGAACEYTRTETTCAVGCAQGACNGEPCAGITCATPPAPRCVDAQTLERAKGMQGSCQSDGRCDYELEQISCPDGCDQGACTPPVAAAKVLISEVQLGSTQRALFIELAGTPGQDLSDYALISVDDAGQELARVMLRGQLGADGLFVLAHPEAPAAVKLEADQLDSALERFAQAPSAVQIEAKGQRLDAVAAGEFAPGAMTYGEGDPAKAPAAEQSISRDKNLSDTDDNATDFRVQRSPSPGQPSTWTPGVDPNNTAPVAVLDCPAEVFAGSNLYVNADGSYDKEGAIVSYDFSVDGQLKASLRHGRFWYSLNQAGPHTIELEVEDADGLRHSSSCTIQVKPREDELVSITLPRMNAVFSTRNISFGSVPPVTEPGELSLSWAAAVCSGPARMDVNLKIDGQSVAVLNDTHSISCGFKRSSAPLTADQINRARTQAGVVEGTIRGSDSCAAGIGCSSLSDPVVTDLTLSFKVPAPIASLSCPAQVDAGQEFMADASGSSAHWGGFSAYTFTVHDGTGSISQADPMHPTRFDAPGEYQLSVSAKDIYNRSSSAVCTVKVKPTAQTPPDVQGAQLMATNTRSTITWQSAAPGLKVVIIRKSGQAPLGPKDTSRSSGALLCDDCTSPAEDLGAYVCGEVYYRVYTVNAQGLYSRGVDLIATLTGAEQLIKAANNNSGDRFGQAIDIEGDWAIVGAPGFREGGGGAAYIFERDAATGWTQRFSFTRPNYYSSVDDKGASVAIHNEFAYVGTPGYDAGGAINKGAVFVLRRNLSGFWEYFETINTPSSYPNNNRFGTAMIVTTPVTLIGSPGSSTVYAYHTNGGTNFAQNTPIITPGGGGGEFGAALAFNGEFLAVGAPNQDGGQGAVFIFKTTGARSWEFVTKLTSLQRDPDAMFGAAVAIRGQSVIVGAPGESKLYRFDGVNGLWPQTETSQLPVPDGIDVSSALGARLDLSQETLIVTAPKAFNDAGAVYHYALINDQWTLQSQLSACGISPDSELGQGVAIDGDKLLIGAPGKGSESGEVQSHTLP